MPSNTILNADMRTVGRWLAGGFVWWAAELGAMVPAWLHRRPRKRGRSIHWDAATSTLHADTTGNDAPIARATVILPPGVCLLREIAVPPMSERDLARMIALDADRLMPLARGEIIVAAQILARDEGRMRVAVAGLPRSAAIPLCEALVAAGGPPAAVLAAPAMDDAEAIDLLPAIRAAGLFGEPDRAAARWWIAVAALFMLNIGIVMWRDAAATDNLQAMVDAQKGAVDVAHAVVGRIRRGDRLAAAISDGRHGREPLAVMARVDAALPAGAWLQRFGWRGQDLRLSGYRPSHADISGAMRRSGFKVIRYSDTDAAGASVLGQPFEIVLRAGER